MPTFPAAFAALEPYAEWALPDENARYDKRLATSMNELQAFYDAALPCLQESTAYLESMSLDGMSDEDKHLLWLFCSLVAVSFPVEVWRQAKVPDSGAASLDAVISPAV